MNLRMRTIAVWLLLAIATVSVMAATASAAEKQPSSATTQASLFKWDGLKNATGKDLAVCVISEQNARGPRYLPKDGQWNFIVPSAPKILVYVAFEYGTNKLVNIEAFITLPVDPPVTTPYPIKPGPVKTGEAPREKVEPNAPQGGDIL